MSRNVFNYDDYHLFKDVYTEKNQFSIFKKAFHELCLVAETTGLRPTRFSWSPSGRSASDKLSCSSPSPPFSGSDPIKIYTMVLHGIEKVDFPKKIGKRPDDLIRRLCR